MLALARGGRQAEALAMYQDAHRRLTSELGVEPGPELREMHARILRGEAELLEPASVAEQLLSIAAAPADAVEAQDDLDFEASTTRRTSPGSLCRFSRPVSCRARRATSPAVPTSSRSSTS